MNNVLKVNVVYDILNIEEKMLVSMRKLSFLKDTFDFDSYMEELDNLKILYRKEQFLISQIPEDEECLDYIFGLLKDPSNFTFDDSKNINIVISRLSDLLKNIYYSLEHETSEMSENEDYEFEYDDTEQILDERKVNFIRNNMLAEYVVSFNDAIKATDDKKVYNIFNNIQFLNVYINKYLFEMWMKAGFNFDGLSFMSDESMRKELGLSEEEYLELKECVVDGLISSSTSQIFKPCKNPKKELIVQDAFFTFKFFLQKLSKDKFLSIKDELYNVYQKLGNHGLFNDVMTSIDKELDRRGYVLNTETRNNESNGYVDMDVLDDIIKLIKFEDYLFDVIYGIDLDKPEHDFQSLSHLIKYEKELVSKINFSIDLFPTLNDLFGPNMWIYLNGDVNFKAPLIAKRLSEIIPIYKELKVPSTQKLESYSNIYENHIIRSLSSFNDLFVDIPDDNLKECYKIFVTHFFYIMPSLTDEFVAVNGKYSLICDLSDNTIETMSGLDDLEYRYDKNEQLYSLGCDILSYIFDNEENIETVSDYLNFQFKISQLEDIINNLDKNYLEKLYRYLLEVSSFFSPLRRDLRKEFKDALSESFETIKGSYVKSLD